MAALKKIFLVSLVLLIAFFAVMFVSLLALPKGEKTTPENLKFSVKEAHIECFSYFDGDVDTPSLLVSTELTNPSGGKLPTMGMNPYMVKLVDSSGKEYESHLLDGYGDTFVSTRECYFKDVGLDSGYYTLIFFQVDYWTEKILFYSEEKLDAEDLFKEKSREEVMAECG